MTIRKIVLTSFTALVLGAGSVAGAPMTTTNPGMSPMPDTANPAQSPHDMQNMDMQKTKDQCAQMRLQMKPGAMSPDMQKTMTECDEMDRNTAASPQFYAPPPDPRR